MAGGKIRVVPLLDKGGLNNQKRKPSKEGMAYNLKNRKTPVSSFFKNY